MFLDRANVIKVKGIIYNMKHPKMLLPDMKRIKNKIKFDRELILFYVTDSKPGINVPK